MKLALYGGVGWQHPFGLAKVLAWAGKYGYHGISVRGYTLDVPRRSGAPLQRGWLRHAEPAARQRGWEKRVSARTQG